MKQEQMGPEDERMDEFEQSLARALKRVEVRADTAAKFLAIAAEAKQQHRETGRMWVTPRIDGKKTGGKLLFLPRPVFRTWVGGALAAALAVGVFVGEQARERAQARKQALAEQQFEAAMRVTDHALDQTRASLERAGLRLGD
jgi:predicted phage tail protein